jgi:TonB family protein
MPKLRSVSWTIFAVALTHLFLITAAAQIITAERVVRLPRPDSRHPVQQPDYPSAAKDRKQEGTVTLDLYVSADGTVTKVMLSHSSGFPALDEAATRAARGWRFIPGTDNGKPTAMWLQFSVPFKITPDGQR